MKKIFSYCISCFLILSSISVFGQTYNMSNTTVTNCSGTLNPSGGTTYSNLENYTFTIAPSGASSVTIVFSSFSTEASFDFMTIYNGPNTSSPVLWGPGSGTTSPGTQVANSGVMTILFTSDGSVTSTGWASTWSCTAPASLPGENCSNAQNLASLSNPYSGTTVGYADDLGLCRTGSPDRIFYISVPNGSTLDIWEPSNAYDEYEYLGYGPTCGSTTLIQCWDNDGLAHINWLNSTGSTQTVWYIQDGFSATPGTFNLQWTLTGGGCTTPGTPGTPSGSGTGQTTASISWAAGSPAGSATVTYYWSLYKTSGSVFVTSGNTTGTSATPSGLTCGTSYYFTVYASTSCNGTSSSTATSGNFSTSACSGGPINDECSGAILLTVNTTCVNTAGTSLNATASNPGTLCNGTEDDDVWYKFVATATTATITVAPSITYDAAFDVRTACGTVIPGSCTDGPFDGGTENYYASGLIPATTYYIRLWDYKVGSGSNTFNICVYSPSCAAPTTQASNVTFPSTTCQTAAINWIRGNGSNCQVFVAAASSGFASPIDGTTYTANSVFGSAGSQIGASGWYCVYDGTGTSVTVTGLNPSTAYQVHVVEYNCTGTSSKYLTATVGTNPANVTTTTPAGDQVTYGIGTWIGYVYRHGGTAALAGTPLSTTNYIGSMTETTVIFNRNFAGGAVTAATTTLCPSPPSDNFSVRYLCQQSFTAGTYSFTIGSDDGARLSVDGGLTWLIDRWSNTAAYTTTASACVMMNGTASLVLEYWEGTANGQVSFSYGACCSMPTVQAGMGGFTNILSASVTANWTRGAGDKVLVVACQGALPSANPVNGTSYAASSVFGSGSLIGGGRVVYDGTGTSVTVTGLTQNTTYYFVVYEYTSAGFCYLIPGSANLVTTPYGYVSQWVSMNVGSSSWCQGETRTLTVTVTNAGGMTWVDGVFPALDVNIGVKWNGQADYYARVNAGNLAPGATQTYLIPITYTASITGSAANDNLTFDVVKEGDCWFASNAGSCGPGNTVYQSTGLTIYNNPTPVANAGPIQNLCNLTSTNLAGNSPTIGIGTWTVTSGSGTVTTPNSPTSGLTGLTTGSPTFLTWSISNGSCPPTTSNTQVHVSNSPNVLLGDAGADQYLCTGPPWQVTLNSTGAGAGTWTCVSGPAGYTITNANSPNTTVTGLASGVYVFRWSESNGCGSGYDDVVIVVQ